MAKTDPDALAEALRANLQRRKARMRAATKSPDPVPSFGSDEEGDAPLTEDVAKPGAWVRIEPKPG